MHLNGRWSSYILHLFLTQRSGWSCQHLSWSSVDSFWFQKVGPAPLGSQKSSNLEDYSEEHTVPGRSIKSKLWNTSGGTSHCYENIQPIITLLRIWMKRCVNHLRGHSPPCSTPPPTAPTPPTLSVLSFTSNVTTTFYCQQSITISYLYVHYSLYALESKLVLSASSPTVWAVEHLAREVVSGKTTTEHIATFKSGKGEEHQNNFWAWYDIEPFSMKALTIMMMIRLQQQCVQVRWDKPAEVNASRTSTDKPWQFSKSGWSLSWWWWWQIDSSQSLLLLKMMVIVMIILFHDNTRKWHFPWQRWLQHSLDNFE